jgi:ectoine hydroxylase-related dioxygenase (phytanoyl-CoA dioxygenase family)
MTTLIRSITDDEIATYERDGVVPLRGVLPLGWVDELRSLMTDVFDADKQVDSEGFKSGASNKGSRTDMVQIVSGLSEAQADIELAVEAGHKPQGRSIVETAACSWHSGLREHYVTGPLPQLVAELTESSRVNLYSDQLFLKEPGSSVRTPWHQDKPFWVLQGSKVAVCWVPVDEVTIESGAMGYVRGSHAWGTTFKPSDFVTEGGAMTMDGIDHDGLADLPPVAANPDDYDIVRYEAGPGDVIVHHWMTLHGSTGNTTAERIRRASSVRFAGEDVTFYLRPSSPDPFRHAVNLADGDDLDGSEHFPRVWPRASDRPAPPGP